MGARGDGWLKELTGFLGQGGGKLARYLVLFPGRPSQQVGREPGNKATKLLAMPVLQLHGVVPTLYLPDDGLL